MWHWRRVFRQQTQVYWNDAQAMRGESDRAEFRVVEAITQVTELMEQLDGQDKQIVMAKFGINRPEPGVAFHVTAKEIKLSTTRAVQLFNRSIETMRSLLTKSTASKACTTPIAMPEQRTRFDNQSQGNGCHHL